MTHSITQSKKCSTPQKPTRRVDGTEEPREPPTDAWT
jgi:hypothetical protein